MVMVNGRDLHSWDCIVLSKDDDDSEGVSVSFICTEPELQSYLEETMSLKDVVEIRYVNFQDTGNGFVRKPKPLLCVFCGEEIVKDGIDYVAVNVKYGDGVYYHTDYFGETGKHFPGDYYRS